MIAASLFVLGAKVTTWRDLAARNYKFSFDQYLQEFEKSYSKVNDQSEYVMRKAYFEAELARIEKHNSNRSSTWKMGLSPHSDRAPHEWKAMKGYKSGVPEPLTASHGQPLMGAVRVADRLDWREANVVTPVKNQGGCGSCWAFSATAVFESQLAIKTGDLYVLGPQELVDCAPNPDECGGSGGCEGSTQWLGFNYTKTAGFALESDYPYQGHDQSCAMKKKKPVATNTGYERLAKNDYSALMQAVNKVGPIAISVDASWHGYEEGVFDGPMSATIDHAVVLDGYGTDAASGYDYWLVRNSWGSSWGEQGYIRIRRFGDGKEPCMTDKRPQDGTECKGGPKTIEVCGLSGLMSDSSYPTGVALK